jgi:hypothetical protein
MEEGCLNLKELQSKAIQVNNFFLFSYQFPVAHYPYMRQSSSSFLGYAIQFLSLALYVLFGQLKQISGSTLGLPTAGPSPTSTELHFYGNIWERRMRTYKRGIEI